MLRIVLHDGYNPQFYKPKEGHVILADHAAHLFGYQHVRMMRGQSSIEHSWLTRILLCHVSLCAESMSLRTSEDMH